MVDGSGFNLFIVRTDIAILRFSFESVEELLFYLCVTEPTISSEGTYQGK